MQPDSTVPLHIIYQDEDLLVLDKPAGLPVHPLRYDETGTLANGLVAQFPQQESLGDRPLMAGLVHRLDTDTSGLILAARSQEVFENLAGSFAAIRSARPIWRWCRAWWIRMEQSAPTWPTTAQITGA